MTPSPSTSTPTPRRRVSRTRMVVLIALGVVAIVVGALMFSGTFRYDPTIRQIVRNDGAGPAATPAPTVEQLAGDIKSLQTTVESMRSQIVDLRQRASMLESRSTSSTASGEGPASGPTSTGPASKPSPQAKTAARHRVPNDFEIR